MKKIFGVYLPAFVAGMEPTEVWGPMPTGGAVPPAVSTDSGRALWMHASPDSL